MSEKMKTHAVIVGGGVAGLSCALQLAEQGLTGAVVETAPFEGGHVGKFGCKATDRCQRCGACLLEDVSRKVAESDRIFTLLGTAVSRVESVRGGFSLELLRHPPRVSRERCNGCGICLGVCPARGALVRSPFSYHVGLVEENCLYFADGSCSACVDACPEHAVNLLAQTKTATIGTDAVVLATGFQSFDPLEKPRFGYGRVPGVMTAEEIDALLRADKPLPRIGESPPRSIAFIQCVGSRDARLGRNYCSRVCCGYALRMVRLMRGKFPWIEPTMFYMDIQTFERDFDRRLEEAAREARLVRAMPAEVRCSSDGRPELVYEGSDENRAVEAFDLVVLSVGISAAPGQDALADLFGVGRNGDGFLGDPGEGVGTGRQGVFVAGTVQGPRSIEETVSHAAKAASQVADYVRRTAAGENR